MEDTASTERPDVDAETQQQITRVRRFNRFYTQQMGVINMMGSGLSLASARVLFEIEQRGEATAVDLCRDLEIDPGYLSRIIRRLEKQELVRKRRSNDDGRRYDLTLTATGRQTYDELTERTHARIGALLAPVAMEDRSCLIDAMDQVERILDSKAPNAPCRIRAHGPTDLSWVVYRHGVLYPRALAVDERFEAMVAGIVASFGASHDPHSERLWIAELGDERVGSIMLARVSDETARLRLFLVEPRARGRRVGSQLLDACLDFARRRGYARIVLSTLDTLTAARHLYERAGFQLAETQPHNAWGPEVVEEAWQLEL